MYFIHLGLIIVFLTAFLVCIKEKIPSELKRDEAYYLPFYRLSALIFRLRGKRKDGRDIRKRLVMLSPARNGDRLYRCFEIRRVGKALMLLFAGNLIALMLSLSAISSNPLLGDASVERNDYGSGGRSVVLDVYADDEPVLLGETLEVGERQYTEEEIRAVFDEMGPKLEQAVLGENESPDHISSDLTLPSGLDGYPVGIEWQLKNYGIMDSEGHLKSEQIPPEGIVQELTAMLSYYGTCAEHRFSVMVYPPEKDTDFEEELRSALQASEGETINDEVRTLPMEVDGRQITYKGHVSGDSVLILVLIAAAGAVVLRSAEGDLQKQMKKRDTQMMIDYPQIVSKLTLLLGAGMTIQGACQKLAEDYEKNTERTGERFAYEELLLTVREMGSGVPESDAYVRFGNRCGLQKYVKLGATLSQNLKRGGARLLEILENEERDAFEERKALARRLGEEAGTKLLAPMGIMLIIVMVIVVVPAFLSFGI